MSRPKNIPSIFKGKTFEEIYGEERAREIRVKMRKPKTVPSYRKNKTYEELYGIERSKEMKKNFSLKRKGKKFSKEACLKRSIEVKERYKDGFSPLKGKLIGDKNPAKRPEVREKIRLSKLGNKNPMSKLENRKKVSDKLKYLYSNGLLLNNIPFKNTKPERKIQDILRQENILFFTDYKLFGRPDIFIEPDICIFIDGNYWHKYPYGTERDQEVNKYLINKRYKVLRLWESEININIEECKNKIKEIIKNGK